MKKVINLNNNIFYYTVLFKDKKNISIKLDSNGEIIVYAPIGISYKYIEGILLNKQKWIINNIDKIKNSYLNSKDKILFLGNQYIQQIEKSENEKIDINGECIFIKTKSLNKEYINTLLIKWYVMQANKVLINRLTNLARSYNLIPSKVFIKNQKSRWGSCNSKNEIRLNWRLILMPYSVIDYIITHELCHLEHMNHSKDFWNLVENFIPNYRDSEKWLKNNGISILKIGY
ncbi:M48 family metallopeptidase [Clostridium nigeriense]|uniref:M48 family metallopeptidase n=1 Tax=Clostridium nigeriense TaxID=1805470 RepID=UPI003D342EC0